MNVAIRAIFCVSLVLFLTRGEAHVSAEKQIQLPELPNLIPEGLFTPKCMKLVATSTKCTCDLALSLSPAPLPAAIRKTISSTCKQIFGEKETDGISDGCKPYVSNNVFDPYAYAGDLVRTAQNCGQSVVDLIAAMVSSVITGIAPDSEN